MVNINYFIYNNYTMKKFILWIIICIWWIFSFCSAEKVENLIEYLVQSWTFVKESWSSYPAKIYEFNSSQYWNYCFQYISMDQNYSDTTNSLPYYIVQNNNSNLSASNITSQNFFDKHGFWNDQYGALICFLVNTRYLYISNWRPNTTNNTAWFSWYYNLFRLDTLFDENIYTSQLNSEQCQIEYNLIPISNVDSNYCETNNLCTVCNWWSWEINTWVNRSSIFLNGTQINWNAIIDIYADERMKTEVEYLNDTVDINITTDYDTNYINNVIDQEKLTPTNEDFESMILWLTEFIPYLFIALLFFVFIKIIRKIRK